MDAVLKSGDLDALLDQLAELREVAGGRRVIAHVESGERAGGVDGDGADLVFVDWEILLLTCERVVVGNRTDLTKIRGAVEFELVAQPGYRG